MIAAYLGDLEMVKEMVKDEEDPSYPDAQQWTALDWAKEASKTFTDRPYQQVLSYLDVRAPIPLPT